MAPALRDGDQVVVWFGVRWCRPGRVVVVALPERPLSVKRLIRSDATRCWVEGDNPLGSTDSRSLGALPVDAVVGVVLLRLWPRPGPVRASH